MQDRLERIFNGQMKYGRTYNSAEAFLDDLRKGELMEGFFLTEDAFQGLIGLISCSKEIAEEVNNNAVLIAIKADKQQELGGILEVAEVCING